MTKEDQDLLFEIVQKRRIEARREEITKNAQETIKSFQNGTANIGNLDTLKADLLENVRSLQISGLLVMVTTL